MGYSIRDSGAVIKLIHIAAVDIVRLIAIRHLTFADHTQGSVNLDVAALAFAPATSMMACNGHNDRKTCRPALFVSAYAVLLA